MTPYLDDGDVRLYQGDVRECPCGCGETFSPIGSRGRPRRYFSPACSLRVNHNRKPSFAGRKHTEEARAKISAAASRPRPWLRGEANGMYGRTGSANPNWKGGVSPERQRLYANAEYRALLTSVRKRDGLRCRHCETQGTLHVHHIKSWAEYPELRFEQDNLITLCKSCHDAEHRKEVCHQ